MCPVSPRNHQVPQIMAQRIFEGLEGLCVPLPPSQGILSTQGKVGTVNIITIPKHAGQDGNQKDPAHTTVPLAFKNSQSCWLACPQQSVKYTFISTGRALNGTRSVRPRKHKASFLELGWLQIWAASQGNCFAQSPLKGQITHMIQIKSIQVLVPLFK